MSTDSPDDMGAPTNSDDPAHGTFEAQNEPTTPGMSPAGSAPNPAEGIPPGRVGESPTPAPQTGQAHRQSNRFTERASQALRLAQEEAVRSKLHYIGTEHLLLGLIREGSGVAAQVLTRLGVDTRDIQTRIEAITGWDGVVVPSEIGLTRGAKRVIEQAVDEAFRLRHHYIGTEHLLLGLLRVSEGIAARVLESQGVTLVAARAATRAATRAPRTGGLGTTFRALRRLFGGPSAPPETASAGQKPNGEG
jgi:ClpA/ClpB-like protein